MAQALIPDDTFYLNDVRINRYILNEHNRNNIPLPDTKIDDFIGVTIHNTNDIEGVVDDAERYTSATLDGDLKDVRVHYYVDENGAWQNLEHDSTSWHAADDEGDGNTKTISIETIMNSSTEPNDLIARDNAARLAAYILYSNGLDENNLYTHTHWLNVRDGIEGSTDYLNTLPNPYKYCPEFILPDWFDFKELVASYIKDLENGNATGFFRPFSVEIITGTLNVRSNPGTTNPIIARVYSGEIYRIIDTKTVNGIQWGKLDSGAGWINMNYTRKI